jgi:lactoylglutathione lyase/glyoxylase I family protein
MSLQNPPARNPSSVLSSLRGHHAAIRVPDYEAEKRWFVEKLDFRVVHEWPYEDQRLAYVAPPNDDAFFVEILGDGQPGPVAKPGYRDLSDSLRYAGFHHVCLQVDDVDATVAELRRRGVTIVTEPFVLDVIQRRLAFFADPFGNLFELAEVLG